MTPTTKTTASPSSLKIGDLIRFTDEYYSDWVGQEGVVLSVDGGSVNYQVTKSAPSSLSDTWNKVGVKCVNQIEYFTIITDANPTEAVAHPAHYGGDTPYEVIKVAEAWDFDQDAYLFNVLKYIARQGKKGSALEDLKKARFYLDRKIKRLEEAAK